MRSRRRAPHSPLDGRLVRKALSARLMDNLIGTGCSAWKLFLDLSPDSDLLVLGCELDNLTNNLASSVGQLFVLHLDKERLRLEKGRFSTSGVGEGNPLVVGGDATGLPFADNCMDCVVLCGALEYCAHETASPQEMQQALLREVRRVVKQGGQIFVGAANRYSYERFSSGANGQLFFNSLMGRGQQNRTYTHSLPGYKRLLKNAGFPHCESLGLHPDKQFVAEIVPHDGNFLGWQAPRVRRWQDRLKRSRFLVPAYGIVASALPKPWPGLENRIFTAVSEVLDNEWKEPGILNIHKYEITGKQKLIVHASRGKQRLLIKHTFDTQGTESERNNHAVLTWLSEHRPTVPGVPKPITSGEISNQVFFAETAVEGHPLKRIVQGDNRVGIVKAAMAFLREINPPETAEHVTFDGALFEEYVCKRLARVLPLLQREAQREQLLTFFQKHFLGKKFLLGVAHGDFSSSNILFNGNRVSGVFDWEAGSVRNVAALDGISLLISVHRAAGANLSLAECLALLATRQWPHSAEFDLLMDLYGSMGIDEECHAGIVYLSWLNGMDLRLRYGMEKDPDAVETYIHDVVAKIGLG